MQKLLIKNIKQLIGVNEKPQLKKGADLKNINSIENAYLAIENGIIVDYGSMADWEGIADWRDLEVIDAEGKFVLPAWCDSHTHIVFAETREEEFVYKIKGMSYTEIAAAGGGILNSAAKLRETPFDVLLERAYERAKELIAFGTGAVEIKSGYGLSTESEIKMLRVIKELKKMLPLTIKSNFLAAHAFPSEYKENPDAYVSLIVNEMLPKVAEENLADYIDVFCDKGFFTPKQTERILEAGLTYGLKGKIHANELDYSGGVQVGTKMGAISVDHLECVGEAEIEALLHSNTIATLLPSTAFFLKMEYPPARKMIDAGLPIALASDYNPGSSPSGNMSFVMALASIYLKMLPEEAINAATLNGAYAMEVQDTLGSITLGKKANFFITKPIQNLAAIPYSFGSNLVESTFINGIKQ
ncbi:MAG: imidazolonepropionase [Luteibaculaceae bacterium]